MHCLEDGKAFCGRGMLDLEKVELVSQKQLSQLILFLRIEMEQSITHFGRVWSSLIILCIHTCQLLEKSKNYWSS
jgi:hypothetical protein